MILKEINQSFHEQLFLLGIFLQNQNYSHQFKQVHLIQIHKFKEAQVHIFLNFKSQNQSDPNAIFIIFLKNQMSPLPPNQNYHQFILSMYFTLSHNFIHQNQKFQ